MSAFLDSIKYLNKMMFHNIQKRIEYELYYGFDPYPFFIERKKLYYEITPMLENSNHIKLILQYE